MWNEYEYAVGSGPELRSIGFGTDVWKLVLLAVALWVGSLTTPPRHWRRRVVSGFSRFVGVWPRLEVIAQAMPVTS